IEMTLPLETSRVAVRARIVHRHKAETSDGVVQLLDLEFKSLDRESALAIEEYCARRPAPRQADGPVHSASAVTNAFVRLVTGYPQKLFHPHGKPSPDAGATYSVTAAEQPFAIQGDDIMTARIAPTPQLGSLRGASAPPLLTILGASAKIEGIFEVEESIEVQCEIAGELHVGGTLVIG